VQDLVVYEDDRGKENGADPPELWMQSRELEGIPVVKKRLENATT
jgi:hypothetical protein